MRNYQKLLPAHVNIVDQWCESDNVPFVRWLINLVVSSENKCDDGVNDNPNNNNVSMCVNMNKNSVNDDN